MNRTAVAFIWNLVIRRTSDRHSSFVCQQQWEIRPSPTPRQLLPWTPKRRKPNAMALRILDDVCMTAQSTALRAVNEWAWNIPPYTSIVTVSVITCNHCERLRFLLSFCQTECRLKVNRKRLQRILAPLLMSLRIQRITFRNSCPPFNASKK